MPSNDTPRAFADISGTNADYRGPGAGTSDPLIGTSSKGIRDFVLRRTVWEARRLGQAVELTTAGDHGEHRILVSPDGTVTAPPDGSDLDDFLDVFATTNESAATGLSTGRAVVALATRAPFRIAAAEDEVTASVGRPSFIDLTTTPTPAGFGGMLARVVAPVRQSKAQLLHADNVRITSQHWAGCRAIAVVNGKGGVGKTMTSAMLASVFARNGGGSVLAWDNNDTRGTLGWRTEPGPHDATVTDAVSAAKSLLAASASPADVAGYVHHQTLDRYDVLRSNPHLLAAKQRIGADEFDKLMQIAARYYRLVIFDSGNDESADRWLRMIDATHQLVVPTLASPESAESAALLLEALTDRDEHSASLARDAVVVVTESERGTAAQTRTVATAFAGLVRAVAVIPFDPALKSGPLRFDLLRASTRRAWIAAAAAIATGLK